MKEGRNSRGVVVTGGFGSGGDGGGRREWQ